MHIRTSFPRQAEQVLINLSIASRSFWKVGLWNSQKDAEEKARAWANVAMVSCVADSNWYLSEIGLLLATLAAKNAKFQPVGS